MEKIMEFIKNNKIVAVIAVVALVLFTPLKKMLFGSGARRRRRRPTIVKTVIRGNRARVTRRNVARKTAAPVARSSAKGYAAPGGGTIPFKYNKNGTIKKAQFVAGTLAAKRRMASLRKNR
jgi:hypothetical protein